MVTLTPEQQACRESMRTTWARIAEWLNGLDIFDRPSAKLPAIRTASAAVDAAALAGNVAACQRACDALEQAYQTAMLAQAGV